MLTQPDVVRAIHDAYLEAGADIIETNTFNATRDRAGRLRARRPRARDQSRRGAHRARMRRRVDRAHAGQAALRRRRAGPDQPHGVDLARRQRSRRAQRDASTSSSPPTARRSTGLAEGGADLILVETIFDTLNAQGRAVRDRVVLRSRRAARLPRHRVRHDHRRVGPHAVGPDARGVLELGAPRAARSPSASIARSARR